MTNAQFEVLIEQYEKLVYSICYQFTKNSHTASDLTQDTFLSAYIHIDSCKEGLEKPWLARIATNKAKDYLKSAYNRKVTLEGQSEITSIAESKKDTSITAEDEVFKKIKLDQIKDVINELKEPYRDVTIMYFIKDLSVDEIAKILNRPTKTVHTQIYRAKIMLKEYLKEDL